MTDKEKKIFQQGYEKGQAEIVCMLADFLHLSLTFQNPVEIAKKIMKMGAESRNKKNEWKD